jgi:hypothetical protein
MGLSRRERRALRKIARALRRENPALASLLSMPETRRRAPDYDAARRRRHADLWAYSRVGRRKF